MQRCPTRGKAYQLRPMIPLACANADRATGRDNFLLARFEA